MTENADLRNIHISPSARTIVDEIMETNFFGNMADVWNFAAGYMLKHHFDVNNPSYELSLGNYSAEDNQTGGNLAVSTLDPNNRWHSLLGVLLDTDTPYKYLQDMIEKGLHEIKREMKNNPSKFIEEEV